MNKSSFTLSPGWHVAAALVLVYMIGFVFLDAAVPRASALSQAGHAGLAAYYIAVGIVVWAIALLILLPRTHNASRVTFIRRLGRLQLPIRYFIAAGVALGLFGIGALLEKYAA